MRTGIEFSDNILTVETFEDLGNVIHDLEIGRLEFSEPIVNYSAIKLPSI